MIAEAFRYLRSHADSLLSIAIRVAGVGLGFIITLLIGRYWGPEAIGQYGVITQTGIFLSLLCSGGLDLSTIRSFSEARAHEKKPALLSVVRLFLLTGAMLLVISVSIYIFRDLITSKLLDNSAVPYAIVLLILITTSRSLTRLSSSFIRSQSLFIFSNVVEILIIPVIVVILLAAQIAGSLYETLSATAAAGIFAATVGTVACLALSAKGSGSFEVALRPLIKRAVPLWGVTVSKNFSDWYSLAIVVGVLSLYDAGIFRIAMQIASALPIITVAIFGVFSTKFGIAHAKSDYPEIARLARSATRLSVLLVVPPGLLGIIMAPNLLSLVGPEFKDSVALLQVFLLGQVIYVCTGPCGLVLAMTGNERTNLFLTVCSLAALLFSLPIAARVYGVMGVVVVMSSILVARNLLSLVAVRKLTGIHILSGKFSESEKRQRPAA